MDAGGRNLQGGTADVRGRERIEEDAVKIERFEG